MKKSTPKSKKPKLAFSFRYHLGIKPHKTHRIQPEIPLSRPRNHFTAIWISVFAPRCGVNNLCRVKLSTCQGSSKKLRKRRILSAKKPKRRASLPLLFTPLPYISILSVDLPLFIHIPSVSYCSLNSPKLPSLLYTICNPTARSFAIFRKIPGATRKESSFRHRDLDEIIGKLLCYCSLCVLCLSPLCKSVSNFCRYFVKGQSPCSAIWETLTSLGLWKICFGV